VPYKACCAKCLWNIGPEVAAVLQTTGNGRVAREVSC